MSGSPTDEHAPKKAKQKQIRSVIYYHECPYCGDPCEDYETSVVGDVLECVCGEKYEVVK